MFFFFSGYTVSLQLREEGLKKFLSGFEYQLPVWPISDQRLKRKKIIISYILSGSRTSLIAQLVKNLPVMQETLVQFLVKKICWRRDRLPTAVFLGFPCGSAGEEFTCNAGDLGLIPGLGRSLGEGKSYPLQYSGLDNSLDCIVHGVAKSRACFEKLAGTNNIYSW